MSEPRLLHYGPFVAYWGGGNHWFRLFGYGLAASDHRRVRPLFTERYNGQHGIKRRLYLHVGPWCIKGLREGGW